MPDKAVAHANLNRNGRTKGSKNKSTMLREALKNGFEAELEKDFIHVVKAVIDKAKEGDMTAAKLIFDRAVPIAEAKGGKVSIGEGGLTIHIERLETHPVSEGQLIEANIEEGEFSED